MMRVVPKLNYGLRLLSLMAKRLDASRMKYLFARAEVTAPRKAASID
jgi:hypothetical protein